MRPFLRFVFAAGVLTVLGAFAAFAGSQHLAKSDRDLAQQMLRDVVADVQKSYYDPGFHGVEWKSRIQEAREDIDKADSMDSAISEIAALLDSLKDSHTRFLPPPRSQKYEYGFRLKVIGDRCYVMRVRVGSDAEKKGLKRGDEIVAINDLGLSRKTFWRINYVYSALRPQNGLRLTVAQPGASPHSVEVMADVELSNSVKYFLHQGVNQWVRDWSDSIELTQPRYFEKGDELLVVRLPAFLLPADDVDRVLGKMRSHRGVVLDLRGNPGGFVDTVDRLLAGMFQHELSVWDRVARNGTTHVSVPGRGRDAFVGRFAVLIDSGSASASEVFARIIQLERRGFVIGDRSAGMVMESVIYRHELYVDSQTFYGASVTDADLRMPDGQSLEHVGVSPDINILPTAQDLASRRDPALAKAATLVGSQLTPEEAGAAFKEDDWKQP